MTPTYVNLGCGKRFRPGWINLDLVAYSPYVTACDLSRGIPLPDASCDVAYHSAVLEHFRRGDALRFLQECRRVLKPGGVLRVGAPDLERICRLYLDKLEAVEMGEPGASADYEWMLLELYDQAVRERPGGEMLAYLRRDPLPNEEFVFERIGEEGRELIQTQRSASRPAPLSVRERLRRPRLTGRVLRAAVRRLRGVAHRLALSPDERRALAIGQFRLSGEVHHWMYDRYSLARLLNEAGFQGPVLQTATTSLIPGWSALNLDTLPDGTVIKPDSFFMEATRPLA